MNNDDKIPAAKAKSDEPQLACKVLVTGTTLGQVILAKGHKLLLPKSQAEALAALNPPRVEITGG